MANLTKEQQRYTCLKTVGPDLRGCGLVFGSWDELKEHEKTHAPLTSNLRACPFCGRSPESHQYAIRGKSYAWVRCEECNLRREFNVQGESEDNKTLAAEAIARWWNGSYDETNDDLAHIVGDIHEAVGEDRDSDHATLPVRIRQLLADLRNEISALEPTENCAYTYDVVAYNESWGGYGESASRSGFKTAEEAIAYAKSCAPHLNAMAFKRTIPIPVERVSVQIYPPENGSETTKVTK